jgi:hypothetical protein
MLLMIHTITEYKMEFIKSHPNLFCVLAVIPANLTPGIIKFQRARGRSCGMPVWAVLPCNDTMMLADVLEFERGTGRNIEADWNVRKVCKSHKTRSMRRRIHTTPG